MLSKLKWLARWLFFVIRWAYFAVSELLGFGGWKDDYKAWVGWVTPMEPLLDFWWVRIALILSGGFGIDLPAMGPTFAGQNENTFKAIATEQGSVRLQSSWR